MVLPQWKRVEKLVNQVKSGTDVDAKFLTDEIVKLCDMVAEEQIVNWITLHVRFMNMKTTVIDYENATSDEQKKQLDKFRIARGIPIPSERPGILKKWEGLWDRFDAMDAKTLLGYIEEIEKQIKGAAYEAKYTGNHQFEEDLRRYYQKMADAYRRKVGPGADSRLGNDLGTAYRVDRFKSDEGKSPAQIREEKRKQEEKEEQERLERRRKRAEETKKRLAEQAKRRAELAEIQARDAEIERQKKEQQRYEEILEKMVGNPKEVTEAELRSLGDKVNDLKQEAENRISKLPRDTRDLKLALIRGDSLSDKTFNEVKETAVGLHGNLQSYIEEVNKIPVGSVLAIQKQPGGGGPQTVKSVDTDSVDMGD